MKQKYRDIVFWAIILIPYLCLIPAYIWYLKTLKNVENSTFIIINKADLTLYHYNYKGQLLQKSSVATGKNVGNKEKIGDMKTPEGIFTISNIENSSDWKHDFKDDTLGIINGAYGPFFIRLNIPGYKGIGIHGTHDDNSISTRASEGCIRMHNRDLVKLVQNIKTVSIVIITPGINDIIIQKKQSFTIL